MLHNITLAGQEVQNPQVSAIVCIGLKTFLSPCRGAGIKDPIEFDPSISGRLVVNEALSSYILRRVSTESTTKISTYLISESLSHKSYHFLSSEDIDLSDINCSLNPLLDR
ncbi:predicted protein [Histoplasma capsulatum H143]|uniref:Uncharacterized protein n=1 Tax=Ajellomyces capsulatus (strain H143) TaxID=544712 RepID=C6HMP8_AJECH|nr:predicted protein [Histoplasma capsulatum H143]